MKCTFTSAILTFCALWGSSIIVTKASDYSLGSITQMQDIFQIIMQELLPQERLSLACSCKIFSIFPEVSSKHGELLQKFLRFSCHSSNSSASSTAIASNENELKATIISICQICPKDGGFYMFKLVARLSATLSFVITGILQSKNTSAAAQLFIDSGQQLSLESLNTIFRDPNAEQFLNELSSKGFDFKANENQQQCGEMIISAASIKSPKLLKYLFTLGCKITVNSTLDIILNLRDSSIFEVIAHADESTIDFTTLLPRMPTNLTESEKLHWLQIRYPSYRPKCYI